jgi:hypothetical protein
MIWFKKRCKGMYYPDMLYIKVLKNKKKCRFN